MVRRRGGKNHFRNSTRNSMRLFLLFRSDFSPLVFLDHRTRNQNIRPIHIHTGISEEKYLHQLYLEEQFGINAQVEVDKPKKKTGVGAAIPFTYEDSDIVVPFTQTIAQVTTAPSSVSNDNDESDSDLDVDVAIDVSKIDTAQAHELNACGRHYGMKSNDFYSFLTKDSDEADALKLAREEEQEKIMLSGRKSRRERRAQRERRFAGRPISPPSYAAKEDEPAFKEDDDKNDSAESRSSTPENSGKVK